MIIDPVRNLGAIKMVCADPRYVLLSMSPDHIVSRASCPDGKVIP